MINENELIWEEFLKESPWRYTKVPSSLEVEMNSKNVDDIKNKDYYGSFKNMEIYHDEENRQGIFYILVDDKFAALYRYKDEGNYLKSKLVWNGKKYPGTLRTFLAEYLLPKYKVIESDDAFSDDAFTMWQKMVVMYPHYEFYAKFPDGKMSKRITNYHEPLIYKEPFPNSRNTMFVMKYNNATKS